VTVGGNQNDKKKEAPRADAKGPKQQIYLALLCNDELFDFWGKIGYKDGQFK